MGLPSRAWKHLGLWLLVALTGGCSAYFTGATEQCWSDDDCPPAAATCDLDTQLCVAPSTNGTPEPEPPVRIPFPPPPAEPAPLAIAPDAGLPRDSGPPRDAGPPPDASPPPPVAADAAAAAPIAPPDAPPAQPSCTSPSKPVERLWGDIFSRRRLTCDRDYLLIGSVFVRPGAELIIDPGTTILGDVDSRGTLVVQPQARLTALGTRDEPVVFTSAAPPGERRPGDWGGLALLGRAQVQRQRAQLDGLGPRASFGGNDDDDSSGELRFVRIEYAGRTSGERGLGAGLILAGVGRGTIIDSVQVRQSADDCFHFSGGAAQASHLICQQSRGDGFDWESGYRGKLQFLILQVSRAAGGETNGLEADNDEAQPSGPVTEPTAFNLSLCGRGRERAGEHYGMAIRRNARAHVANVIVAGFDAGIDLRGHLATLDLNNALFDVPIAYEEDGSNPGTQADDDGGRDEIALFHQQPRQNRRGANILEDCFDPERFGFYPEGATGARTPPDDGFFDARADHLGAIRDRNDRWAEGNWVVWTDR